MLIRWGVGYARLALAAAVLLACNSDRTTRGQSALQGTMTMGGSSGVGPGTALPASAAPSAAPPPTPGSPVLTRGDRLEFLPGTGDLPYVLGPNAYGLVGSGFLARSALGNSITVGTDAGKICVQGTLAGVPNGDYGEYWGVELGFNLTQLDATSNGAPPGAMVSPGAVHDAGDDAGRDASVDAALTTADASSAAPGMTAAAAASPGAWSPGKVIGFSFVIGGATIDMIRFKALPDGYDRSLEASVYCKQLTPPSGAVDDVLFTDMTQYCWDAPPQALIPLGKGLDNISWQLPADAAGPRAFDWCLTELRPILAD